MKKERETERGREEVEREEEGGVLYPSIPWPEREMNNDGGEVL